MRPAQTSASLPVTATDLTSADPAVIGPYRPLKRLGAGGMGVVYAAVDPHGALAAVKVIHPEYAADAEFRSRFAREVETLSRVGGACAVPLLAADTGAERPWLAMPLVRGFNLGTYVRQNEGPLPASLVYGLALGVAEALTQIHAAGVVHRDLKPANIVISPEGPRVLDFGIARALDQTALTRTGSLLGSPGWISPAHYRGEGISTADDVFAWGALVAYAATGRPPFGTGDPAGVAHRVLSGDPDLEGFTGPLSDLVRRALAKEAELRPTALELVTGVLRASSPPGATVASFSGTDGVGQVVGGSLQNTWVSVRLPEERHFDVVPPPARDVAERVRSRPWTALVVTAAALLLLAVVGLGGAVFSGHLDASLIGNRSDDDGTSLPVESAAGDEGDGSAKSARNPEETEASDGPSDGPSEEDGTDEGEAGGSDGGGGDEGTTATASGLVGAGVSASGSRPSGDHVIAFRPDGGSGVYAKLDGATVVCAWSFCQSQGGGVGNGGAGSVSSSPSALTGYANQGSRTVKAEVTYTTAADGTVTITRLVEYHRTSGTGTPPW
ncbi:serine/threonine-protein kinase [Nocardiopsis sp. N85]|uniref:serine/threonine-protein kinase n=1 Tax=Nocardiopsis sp. N85 TaxID=3029400 RepID=UPI00237F5300|nr:serine/threonine-protein kinase [Nocardiopsis sp. N85]MDE3723179.1 serine/threonine-protein kinase [Nocardiopsis sp. N85]